MLFFFFFFLIGLDWIRLISDQLRFRVLLRCGCGGYGYWYGLYFYCYKYASVCVRVFATIWDIFFYCIGLSFWFWAQKEAEWNGMRIIWVIPITSLRILSSPNTVWVLFLCIFDWMFWG